MKTLIILLLSFSICQAAEFKNNEYKDSKGKKYLVTEIPLVSDYSLKKPVINETKILNEDEKEVVEFSLKENGRKLIMKEHKPAKNDYKHDFDRGTVYYTPESRNYSFHKVIIPDGTVIKETNFTQKEPHTQAIEGKNLTFIGCNLVNVELDPTWNVEGNTCQIKRVKKSEVDLGDGKKKVIISHQVETNGVFTEVAEDEEIVSIGDRYNLLMLRLNK